MIEAQTQYREKQKTKNREIPSVHELRTQELPRFNLSESKNCKKIRANDQKLYVVKALVRGFWRSERNKNSLKNQN